MLLPNLLCLNFDLRACVEFDNSSNKLRIRKYFEERSCHHIQDVICAPHLLKDMVNISV